MAGAYRNADATVSARGAVAVTLSDTTVINNTRALYIGVGGTLKVSMVDGQDAVFVGLPAGTILPIQVTKVWVTGSVGVASILALY